MAWNSSSDSARNLTGLEGAAGAPGDGGGCGGAGGGADAAIAAAPSKKKQELNCARNDAPQRGTNHVYRHLAARHR